MGGDLRLGLIGCGRLAERGYVPAVARVPGLRLAAVVDRKLERCARAAPGVPALTSTADLVASGTVDALVLATPAAAHLADARLAAGAGLPTLIEKPPAPTLQEALQLARLEPPPWMGFNRRFVPEIASLRAAVTARPVELTLEMHTRSPAWGSYVADDDALLNLGPHLVDLARWLSSVEVARVRAAVAPSHAEVELELAQGRGRARLKCAADRSYRERVRIEGRTRYSAGGAATAIRRLLAGKGADHPLVPSLARQLAAFARVARGEPEPMLANALDGVAVMAALEAARASAAREGEWEAVGPRLSSV
jgi:myo-inositol 2-dehydrogenase / D-chiro-inositol 1-dehydrogenase